MRMAALLVALFSIVVGIVALAAGVFMVFAVTGSRPKGGHL